MSGQRDLENMIYLGRPKVDAKWSSGSNPGRIETFCEKIAPD